LTLEANQEKRQRNQEKKKKIPKKKKKEKRKKKKEKIPQTTPTHTLSLKPFLSLSRFLSLSAQLIQFSSLPLLNSSMDLPFPSPPRSSEAQI
jgi:hypothetical protein